MLLLGPGKAAMPSKSPGTGAPLESAVPCSEITRYRNPLGRSRSPPGSVTSSPYPAVPRGRDKARPLPSTSAAAVASVTLNGATTTDYRVRETNRGKEVLVNAKGAGAQKLVVKIK